MSTYIYALIVTAVAAAVAELLTDGHGSSGAVRLVAGLCALLAMAQPIKGGIQWLHTAASTDFEEWISLPDDAVDAELVFQEQMGEVTEQAVTEAAKAIMKERFDVSGEQCRVEAVAVPDGETVKVERITVWLSGAAILKNPHTIEAFMEETFGGDCVVAVE